jgi:PPM family protein phosphatase
MKSFAARHALLSERGRRARNEDAALAVALPGGVELVAVADGMGGHAAGDVASGRALEALRAAIDRGQALREAVGVANEAVLEESQLRPEYAGMGTTLVALLRQGEEYYIANVGDSRAYRIDDAGIRQLTHDHSFVADAVRSGQLTAQEAGASRWRNALTRAIGVGSDLEVDCHGPFSASEPHIVVLCTDGLHRAVSEDRIREAVRGTEPLDVLARVLAADAHEGGSDDNISLAIVRFGDVRASAQAVPAERAPPEATADAPFDMPDRSGARFTDRRRAFLPAAAPRRDRRRRRRPGHVRRWARVEVAAILLGVMAVILYVLALTRVL